MQHCDDETLSLLALGETVTADVSDHVSQCPRCAGEVRELTEVVDAVRPPLPLHTDARTDGETDAVPPPPHVWEAIAAATGVRAEPRPGAVERNAELASLPEAATPVTSAPTVPTVLSLDRPRPSRPARSGPRRGAILAVAASTLAAGLAAGIAGTLAFGPERDTPPPDEPALASTALEPLPAAPSASGRAEVVRTETGRRLDVDVVRLGAAEGFYQVWLIDATVKKMVPIGVLRGDHGEFVLPDGVRTQDYPVVDISVEPLDGNPAHSGKSVLRGAIKG